MNAEACARTEPLHVVALSGGKDSTALALALREREPREYVYLSTPVGNELAELFAHLDRLEALLGKPIQRLQPFGVGVDGLVALIQRYSALPNWRQRWCTRELKIEPTIAWLRAHAPCVQYVGLRADEESREGIYGVIEGVEQRYPFREWGWDEKQIWIYLAEQGIKIPRRTDCAWCFGQRLIEWKRLWQEHPDVYEAAVQLEKQTGHTFRSPGRDTWPAALEDLRAEFERGRKVRGERPVPAAGRVELELYEEDPERGPCRVCSL